jgi:CRP/FNR family transcriptional regulator
VQILETFGPGEVFALVSAVDGGPYPASAEARDDAALLLCPREALEAALDAAPAAALAVARVCAGRLRRFTTLIASVSLEDTRARVAAHLVRLAQEGGAKGEEVIEVALGGPQHEVAQRLGMAREVYAGCSRGCGPCAAGR